jgi:hypothetical protein
MSSTNGDSAAAAEYHKKALASVRVILRFPDPTMADWTPLVEKP